MKKQWENGFFVYYEFRKISKFHYIDCVGKEMYALAINQKIIFNNNYSLHLKASYV